MLNIYQRFRDSSTFEVGKLLGKGSFGEVREIKLQNKILAGKLVKRKINNKISEEEKVGIELRGKNIIKINKIYTKNIDGNVYDLIIMEKAILRDLGKFNEFYHNHNLLKIIYQPFDEKTGDNLLRFFCKQIVNGLEILERSDYIHYDIKPENLLITINLIIKLSDFSLISKAIDGNNIAIPGGTQGYLTPEYYEKLPVSCDTAKKQDYFALGSTLFCLKFGEPMLKYKSSDKKILNADKIIEMLQRKFGDIKSQKLSDKGFIEFLCSLIQYKPKDRPLFEKIYRNKWLNKDNDKINTVFSAFENDEEKLIMELQKLDFLIKKEKEHMNNSYNLKEKQKEFKNSLFERKNQSNKNTYHRLRFRFIKKKINFI